LLPDLPWKIENNHLILNTPNGSIHLQISQVNDEATLSTLSLIREGMTIFGSPTKAPILGWVSPTYAMKKPALSLLYEIKTIPPIELTSDWYIENHEKSN
jgi:hypothetical protein